MFWFLYTQLSFLTDSKMHLFENLFISDNSLQFQIQYSRY